MRTCVGCRRTLPTDRLVRVARSSGGSVEVGRDHPGRGAWLCRDSPGCLDQAVKKKAFDRALRGPVGSTDLDRISSALRSEAPGGPEPG